jgi:hypothetical protein
LFFIKDGDWKAKPESGSTKKYLHAFFCYRESFDKENQEEEGKTGPRLYTTTFLPRIRSRSNKVPYPTPVLWIRIDPVGSGTFWPKSDPDPELTFLTRICTFFLLVQFVFDYLYISSVLRIRTYSKKKKFIS